MNSLFNPIPWTFLSTHVTNGDPYPGIIEVFRIPTCVRGVFKLLNQEGKGKSLKSDTSLIWIDFTNTKEIIVFRNNDFKIQNQEKLNH